MHYFPENKHCGTEPIKKKDHTARIMSFNISKIKPNKKKSDR